MLGAWRSTQYGDIQKLQNKDWLHHEYISETKSTIQIAKELGLNDETVRAYLIDYGIERRERIEAVPSGEDHYAYKGGGGLSYYGPNWDEQKLKARIRDHCQCQVCGKHDGEHIEQHGRVNHVHHIKPRRDFIDDDGLLNWKESNKLSNLITLCSNHHPKLEGILIDNRN